MTGDNVREFRRTIYIILILIIILVGLNVNKYMERQEKAVPVWSEYDEEYYAGNSAETGIIPGVINFFKPGNIIFKLTRIKLDAPITYLKREIPLLAYYTPDAIKKPSQTIYQPGEGGPQNQVVRLKFDLTKSNEVGQPERSKEQINNQPVNRREEQPLVAIYHTHTSETYIDDPRMQDNNGHVKPGKIGNVGTVGLELAKKLSKKYNFRVIHTTKVHDKSYARAYYNSRQTVKNIISHNQDISLILDIHRNGIEKVTRDAITTTINGKNAAKIMLVVTNGKFDFAHLNLESHHTQWQQNLTYAKRIAEKMKEMYPGLLQRIEMRDTTYNQDLHPRSLLVEIGDYHNTTHEAVRSARLLADVIASVVLEKK